MHPRRPPIAIAVALLLSTAAACSSPPSDPTPASTISAGDPSSPPATGAPGSGELGVGAIVQVVADEVRLRSEPSTSAGLVLPMPRGHALRVEGGPTDADGFRWWQVVDVEGRSGWAADGDRTDAWLAAPRAAEAAPLLQLDQACDVTFPLVAPATTILDDGSVILTLDSGPPDPELLPWRIGRLAPAGLAEIEADVIGSPYLSASAEYLPEALPGVSPPGHGACSYTFTVRGGEVVVEAIGWFGDEEEAEFWQPSPERKTLTDIALNLIALDAVLDEAMWSAPPTLPYLATTYTLLVSVDPAGGPGTGGLVELAEDPLIGLLEGGVETEFGRCVATPLSEAFELATGLDDAAPPSPLHAMVTTSFVVDQTLYGLTAVPQLPPGQPSCDELGS